MLVFEERGKPECPEKNLSEQGENQQKTQPAYDTGSGNRTQATLVGGERSHHCATPAPPNGRGGEELKKSIQAPSNLSPIWVTMIRGNLVSSSWAPRKGHGHEPVSWHGEAPPRGPNSIPFYIPFLIEKLSFSYTFHRKMHPYGLSFTKLFISETTLNTWMNQPFSASVREILKVPFKT